MEKENEVRWFCTLAILKYNLPDVRSSGNESGLYDVDSSWPTEYWVVKKEIAKLPHLRPSLISQWPFGVLVRQAASSKYFIDAQPAQWRKQPLPSVNVSARGLSDPDRAAICRGNDLVDGVRVLFFLPATFGHQPLARSHRLSRCCSVRNSAY
ncbi:hypothetical protein T03_10681 [Trichinella britovi]|uniref:Uncharacterized protein n=1 Tax=Trichinella britovi TaxID=45882 RepID=A0A0V1CAQ6_TRIBR|nr:hypothetical protein T03_10681 [Trichinella britovi]